MDTSLLFDDLDLLEEHYSSVPRQAPRYRRTASAGLRAPRSDIGKQHRKPAKKPTRAPSGRPAAALGHEAFSDAAYMDSSADAAAVNEGQPGARQDLLEDLERLQQPHPSSGPVRVPATNTSERGKCMVQLTVPDVQ